MSNKSIILCAIAKFILLGLFVACQGHAPRHKPPAGPGKVVKIDSFLNNASLGDILEQVAAVYHVRICNPNGLEGVPITGMGLPRDSIGRVCRIINIVEKGRVYLHYQDGVVFVSRVPLPERMVVDKKVWPCG